MLPGGESCRRYLEQTVYLPDSSSKGISTLRNDATGEKVEEVSRSNSDTILISKGDITTILLPDRAVV